jgi:altered-inheritance-of-mitochondria protein 13
VSQSLVEALESSNEVSPEPPSPSQSPASPPNQSLPNPQTDVSRLQTLELHIQQRVAAELKRLRAQEADALRDAQQKLSAEPSADQKSDDLQRKLDGGPSRQEVSKAVEALQTKLEARRKVRQLPGTLESARDNVERCLRENDRRPLDCWREVEAFKEEVRRMEKGWVEKVVG